MEKFQRDNKAYLKKKREVQLNIRAKAEARRKLAEEIAREEAEAAAEEEALNRQNAGS